MNTPVIKNVLKSDDAVELRVSFPGDADYFKGHFQAVPILPGVAQIHWAMKFAEDHFGIIPHVTAMKAVKFSHVISPDTDVTLKLTLSDQRSKLTYAYSNGDMQYSSGAFILQNS